MVAALFVLAAWAVSEERMLAHGPSCYASAGQCANAQGYYLWDVGEQGPFCAHDVLHRRVMCADSSGENAWFEVTCQLWTPSGSYEECNTACSGEWCDA
jgi:hypothetical protein